MGKAQSSHHRLAESEQTMRALAFAEYKKPLQLVSDLPIPELRKDEVLVRVLAASFNPIDKVRASGALKKFLPEPAWPAVIGYDLSGIVEKSNLPEVPKGTPVVSRIQRLRPGALAEFCAVPAASLVQKPEGLSFVEAAALPLAGMTAYQALRDAKVQKGDRVFISAGAGGVGTVAIQLAVKVFHCSHVAVGASPGRGEELCRRLGAHEVVDYRAEKFWEKEGWKDSFDFVLDCTGNTMECLDIAKKDTGRVWSLVGKRRIRELDLAVRRGIDNTSGRGLSKVVKWVLKLSGAQPKDVVKRADAEGKTWTGFLLNATGLELGEFMDTCMKSKVRPVVDKVFTLDEADKAWEEFSAGRSKGKVVVKVAEAQR